MNTILLGFSSTAVAVYGVCNRMGGLCTVGVHGIDNGLIPIVAYNYGAAKPSRIREAVKWALMYSFIFYLPFLLILEAAPEMVMRLFNASPAMMAAGSPAVRLIALAWLISIPSQVTASALQGLSLPNPSMVLTLTRQAVLPLCLAFAASLLGHLTAVWAAFSVAEAIGVPLALVLWKRAERFVTGNMASGGPRDRAEDK